MTRPADSVTGTVLNGRYELVERWAEGGMASVWRANVIGEAGFRRPVAVKRILPTQDEEDFVRMFVEEARVGSQLQHPNIVSVFDFGRDEGGMYYIVMEWVEGLNLNEYMNAYRQAGHRLPWPLVAVLGIEALRGLRAAHERLDASGHVSPVIHRDVTPSNILIGTNGVVRLTDFGVSRAMDRASWTSPDIVKGKLCYMAPEIFADEDASPQSDMFALGVALWEALAGRRLYKGTDVEIFIAAREANIPDLVQFRDDLPEDLVQILERCLHRQPEQRFPSALQMIRELGGLMRKVPQPIDEELLARSVHEVVRYLRQRPEDIEPPPGTRPYASQLTVPAKPVPVQDSAEQVFVLTRRKQR